MPTISEILGRDKFNSLISQGFSDDAIKNLAITERKKQLQQTPQSNEPQLTEERQKNVDYLNTSSDVLPQAVRGITSNAYRLLDAADYVGEKIGFDLVSDETTNKLNKQLETFDKTKENISQQGLSKERIAELTKLKEDSVNAQGLTQNVKAGVNQAVDLVTHPSEWTIQGTAETLIDPLNAISFGAGGIASKVAKSVAGKTAVGAGAGAVEGATVNSAYEYAVAKGQNKSDEEASKAALQSAAGGAVIGSVGGGLGGAFAKPIKQSLENKSAAEILDNGLLKTDDENTPPPGGTSLMQTAREVLKDDSLEVKNKIIESVSNPDIYNTLTSAEKLKSDKLIEYEKYQEALNPEKQNNYDPLEEVKQKRLNSIQKINDSLDALPPLKEDDFLEIDKRIFEVQDKYKKGDLLEEDYKPNFQIVFDNLPATLNELVDTELIDPDIAKQIEYKNKVLQLAHNDVIYAGMEGWTQRVSKDISDAVNLKKINEINYIEQQTPGIINEQINLTNQLLNEGATPIQIDQVINQRFLPSKIEKNITNLLNDNQPIVNKYSGLRLRELTNNTIAQIEQIDLPQFTKKLDDANVQPELKKAVLESLVNKDINYLDNFIHTKVSSNIENVNKYVNDTVQKRITNDFKKVDTEYQTKINAKKEKPIEDFGEKIGGARKDFYTNSLKVEDLDSMNDMEASKTVLKKNIWKPLDYRAMKESGFDAKTSNYIKLVKDALPAAPILSKEAHINYINFVNDIKNIIENSSKDFDSVSSALKKYIDDNFKIKNDYGYSWNEKATLYSRQGILNNNFLTKIRKSSNYISNSWDKLIVEKGTRVVDENKKIIPKKEYLSSIQRDGRNWRDNKDIDENTLQETFGFRAGEFGNWVNQKERQTTLNHAFDALMDLAEVLQIPPKAISLNGELAIAFGARGKSSALAHYEPSRVVINLTKMKGAGSLAHEWLHAFDNYVGKMGYEEQKDKALFVSHLADLGQRYDRATMKKYLPHEGIKIDIIEAVKKVNDSIFNRVIPDDELIIKYRKQAAKYKDYIDGTNSGKYDKANKKNIPQWEEFIKINEKRISDIENGIAIPEIGTSLFFTNAKFLDKGSTKSYWATKHEMLARAFEAYIFDKSKRSDYLVAGVEDSKFADAIYKGDPYPSGNERKVINNAFDELFDTINNGSLKGFEKFDMKKFDEVADRLVKGCE